MPRTALTVTDMTIEIDEYLRAVIINGAYYSYEYFNMIAEPADCDYLKMDWRDGGRDGLRTFRTLGRPPGTSDTAIVGHLVPDSGVLCAFHDIQATHTFHVEMPRSVNVHLCDAHWAQFKTESCDVFI